MPSSLLHCTCKKQYSKYSVEPYLKSTGFHLLSRLSETGRKALYQCSRTYVVPIFH